MRLKNSRSTYIIFALVCLIVFNLGTILIKIENKSKSNLDYGAKTVFSYNIDKPKNENFFIVFGEQTHY